VVVEGYQRPLHPLLRDEVYRIGREGILNAFRHAQASHIEAELRYSSHQFQLSCATMGPASTNTFSSSPRTVPSARQSRSLARHHYFLLFQPIENSSRPL
jgi:hypothetical protein